LLCLDIGAPCLRIGLRALLPSHRHSATIWSEERRWQRALMVDETDCLRHQELQRTLRVSVSDRYHREGSSGRYPEALFGRRYSPLSALEALRLSGANIAAVWQGPNDEVGFNSMDRMRRMVGLSSRQQVRLGGH
jgi:hypothetical protein